jgi:RNA polymerase sigma-70 factor (ECF subfamily)
VKILGTLYQDHRERLFHYLLRMTADYDLSRDLMQESFTRCLERYGDEIETMALLYRVARNLAVDHLRKAARSEPLNVVETADPVSLDHQLMVREQYRDVLGALQTLSLEDRELLSLVAGEALSYRDMAAILETSENNIKVRVHRARKRLRGQLSKRGES